MRLAFQTETKEGGEGERASGEGKKEAKAQCEIIEVKFANSAVHSGQTNQLFVKEAESKGV